MRQSLGRWSLVVLGLFAGIGLVPAHAAAPKPVIERAVKGDRCVEDTDYMRRNHMKLLTHHRDETVHEGIRSKKYSLKQCINCHASKETGSVTAAKDNFCVSCHSYAAVKIDCFDCHSSRPQASAKSSPLSVRNPNNGMQMTAQGPTSFSIKDIAGVAR